MTPEPHEEDADPAVAGGVLGERHPWLPGGQLQRRERHECLRDGVVPSPRHHADLVARHLDGAVPRGEPLEPPCETLGRDVDLPTAAGELPAQSSPRLR